MIGSHETAMVKMSMEYAALCWLRFRKRMTHIATEVSLGTYFVADVLGSDGKKTIEIEIKRSLSDLKRDFTHKGQKHKDERTSQRGANYFYFLVPKKLEEQALEILGKENPKYGLLVFEINETWDSVMKCVRPARKLHSNPPSPKHLEYILLRQLSDYLSLFGERAFMKWGNQAISRVVMKYVKTSILREEDSDG